MAVAGVGFLSSVTNKVREYTDEMGAATSKFTDARLLTLVRRAYSDIIDEINRVSKGAIRARIDISVVSDQREYLLPPGIGRFLEFKKLDTDGNFLWEIEPRHPLAPFGPGFTIEGPMLRLDPVWKTGETMRVEYQPTAEATIFEATASAATANTISTPASVTAGSVDTRTNAYLGWVLRILSDSGGGGNQDRVISSEDRTTASRPVFTVLPDFSPTPGGSSVFEVVPAHAYRFEDLIALKVSRFVASVISSKKAQGLQAEYADAMRSAKLAASKTESRHGIRWGYPVRGRRIPGRTR